MHELSLLIEAVRTVERYARENPEAGFGAERGGEPIGAGRNGEPGVSERDAGQEAAGRAIESLTLTVGELSSAVPEHLEKLWPEASRGTVLDGAELIIERAPATARCGDCGAEFGFKETRGVCPGCGGKNAALAGGREFFVKEIAIIDAPALFRASI